MPCSDLSARAGAELQDTGRAARFGRYSSLQPLCSRVRRRRSALLRRRISFLLIPTPKSGVRVVRFGLDSAGTQKTSLKMSKWMIILGWSVIANHSQGALRSAHASRRCTRRPSLCVYIYIYRPCARLMNGDRERGRVICADTCRERQETGIKPAGASADGERRYRSRTREKRSLGKAAAGAALGRGGGTSPFVNALIFSPGGANCCLFLLLRV